MRNAIPFPVGVNSLRVWPMSWCPTHNVKWACCIAWIVSTSSSAHIGVLGMRPYQVQTSLLPPTPCRTENGFCALNRRAPLSASVSWNSRSSKSLRKWSG